MYIRSMTTTTKGSTTTTRIACWGRGASSSSPVPPACGFVRGAPSFFGRQLLAPLGLLLVVAVALLGPAPVVAAEPLRQLRAAGLLKESEPTIRSGTAAAEGGGGWPAKACGVSFGTEVSGSVASGAAFPHFANAPSPVAVAVATFRSLTDGDSTQAYATVLGGFYGAFVPLHEPGEHGRYLVRWARPDRDRPWHYCRPSENGTVPGRTWENFTVPIGGRGGPFSAGFSTNANGFLVDDGVIELAPPTPTPPPTPHSPTQAPTKPPTKGPTERPTKAPTAARRPTRFPAKAPTNVCLRGVKGAHMKRCMTKKKTV
jgi:hypothetical protein